MTMPRCALALLLVALLLAVAAADASAAPIALGEDLATSSFPEVGHCQPNGCTIVQLSLGGPGAPLVSPVNGAIVSWSIAGATATPGYRVQVLNRNGLTFTAVRASESGTPIGLSVETFPTSVPIAKGQYIGFEMPSTGTLAHRSGGSPSGEYWFNSGILADGAMGTNPETAGAIGYSAVVQPAPTVSSLSATSGSVTGGTAVTIAGTDLEGATAVSFGSTPAKSFSVSNETTISAVAPASASLAAVPVSVTTVAGTATSTATFSYQGCTVPKLKGKKLKAAKSSLKKAGCRLGKVTKKKGASAKTGKVAKQGTAQGKLVAPGAKVNVTLAP
ncbi:MAG TPA: IPT/TIG domain-containing protein [Solirubrobacterales bacterium]|nr:IPT/TIG domain-containing protein [Solirubrobacterales bacterium]